MIFVIELIKKEESIYLRCRQSSYGCKARMTMKNDQITTLNDYHNHEPENDFIMKLKFKNEMKENISSNNEISSSSL